jgi:ATP-dependent helicase/nuclease subunit A
MSVALDFDVTRRIQWEASDPATSAWVVANAGSGKTHLLTQRVIRLLLSGADPAAVLCLTFTKVAAAEMSRRIFDLLGSWTMLPEPALAAAIQDVQGRPATAEEMRRARRLFARALETPGGLKIQTIHAFCERLLHQFPFEANVPGQFTILDDSAAAALVAEARAEVMNAIAAAPGGRLGGAMRYLAEHATDQQIAAALDAVIAGRNALRRWTDLAASVHGADPIESALLDLRERLKLAPQESEGDVCRDICRATGWGRADCGGLAEELLESLAGKPHDSNRRAQSRLAAICAAEDAIVEASVRLDFFLSWDAKEKAWRGFSPSQRFGAEFARRRPGLVDSFTSESNRLLSLVPRLAAVRSFAATEALLVVGDAILQAYHSAKRRSGALDFGDLIVKARALLSRADAAAWVLYKLDARIEHILVDEAQDTSPDQWAVVQSIAQDFFAGESAARGPRTIFAVGDDKQSIFGFQGAEPKMLAEMARFFERLAAGAEAGFIRRPLALSFRSTSEVLGAVDEVFSGALAEEVTASGYEAHAARRHAEPGHVVLLPRVVRPRAEEPEDWTEPFDAPTAAEVELAGTIAAEIERLIGTHLPSGKRVTPGGILILARKRDAFVSAVNRALRERRIDTAGADRVPVTTHIAVLDLLALADVMLLPQDDLQLAACLKSPLVGLGEDELLQLASGRQGSLWAALQSAEDLWFRTAAERLRRWRDFADQATPFRFFATVLGPDGGRRAFRARLGGEAEDVLDAFLSQALAYESLAAPSLQGFVAFMRASQGDIKRETEESSGGVRVMTVHGAKGLEADVVFLVDTGGLIVVPGHREVLVQIGDPSDPAFLWRRTVKEATALQQAADTIADRETRREYLRLLYVAMTRARDVLYVCGIRGERTEAECWYSLVEKALVPPSVERNPESGELAAPFRWPESVRAARSAAAQEAAAEHEPAERPDWLFRPAPSPTRAPQPLRPSRALADPDPPIAEAAAEWRPETAVSPLARGRIMHRLLQALGGPGGSDRRGAAERLASREIVGPPELAKTMLREAEAVRAHPELAEAFGPESRAEVAIVGRVAAEAGEHAVSGQIDRLARTSDGWHLLDFKTNRSVPASLSEVDPAYILQLGLYRRLLMDMQPGASVRATLVYTAGPNVMPIPAEAMERALAKLGVRGTAFP